MAHKDRRTYQDRKAYQREYQKRWRKTEKGKTTYKSIEAKRGPTRNEHRRIVDEGNKTAAFKSFKGFFEHNDPVSILPQLYINDPSFTVISGGKRTIEWLSQPLPTWTDTNGVLQGGHKWNGCYWE